VQREVFALTFLERARRLEQRHSVRDAEGRGAISSNLPHVDNLESRAAPKKKMKMQPPQPVVKDLVLIGGGHAHAYTLKNLGMNPIPGVQVTLITRDVDTPYSGMLPGHIAGFYTRQECHIDLVKLGNFAKAKIVHAEACGLDPVTKQVFLNGRPPIQYDVLSINIGSAPQTAPALKEGPEGSGVETPVTPVKPIDKFSKRWEAILDRARGAAQASRDQDDAAPLQPLRLVVVGGGAGGVELALSMQARLRREVRELGAREEMVEVTLVARSKVLMPAHNPEVQKTFRGIAERRGINLILGAAALGVKGQRVLLEGGREVPCDEVVWCTSAGAQAWLKPTGLQLDPNGFIEVQDTLESVNTPDVFAVGDIAALVNHPRPKAGVFAVRGGPPLTNNLRKRLAGQTRLEQWHPQTNFLGIIGTGDPGVCVASRGELCLEGAWLWELKDWIDRTWMAGYTTRLPLMEIEEEAPSAVALAAGPAALAALSHASMRCGGCGAKVGATVLSNVMRRLRADGVAGGDEGGESDVLVGLDSPDDCAVVRCDPQGRASVHTVDFFRSFIKDPFLFGKIAANHALSDCHAMCAVPTTALAIAVVPYGLEDKVEEDLYQMMSGACRVLAESNCKLVGGHTCEGAELSLGLVVNGLVEYPNGALTKGGLKKGDAVILTKGVGTGTIFAADMRGKAQGAWVASALDSMQVSNREAALVLRDHKAAACTDVTGFGVLGHLLEMVRASSPSSSSSSAAASSSVDVHLSLDALPCLAGAVDTVRLGIFSSLQPANLRLKRAVANEADALDHPKYPLLFDPQTAGGLLAAVPASQVDACLAQLRSLPGHQDACVIGTVETAAEPSNPSIKCV